MLSGQKFENANYIDDIDDYLKERNVAASQKTCVDCRAANDETYRSCRNCSGKLETPVVQINVSNEDRNSDWYSHFKFEINRNNIKVQVGEPDFVNPILLKILQQQSTILEEGQTLQNVILKTNVSGYF